MFNNFEELKKGIEKDKVQDNWIDAICFLISEKGMSYQDLMGVEYEIEFQKKWLKNLFGNIRIKREGVPLPALVILLRFIEKKMKEEEKAMSKAKRGRR